MSLSTAAIALPPLTPTLLLLRLRARGDVDRKIATMSLVKRFKVAAYFRLVIFVLLRMVASSVVPLNPISLPLRLRARGRGWDRGGNGERVACQWV